MTLTRLKMSWRLNGWQRLSVVTSLIWTVFTLLVAYTLLPQPSAISRGEVL